MTSLQITPEGASRKRRDSVLKRKTAAAAIAVILSLVGLFCLLRSGDYLVVNQPERSDVIVALAGDHNDRRYWSGLDLLRRGFGQQMVLDVPGGQIYGHSFAERASEFVARTAGGQESQVSICVIAYDSTVQEASDIRTCLERMSPAPRSVLLVTNDFHTRRALSIMRSRLPQYRWSVAAVNDTSLFGVFWWRHREWAKTWFYEWQKVAWWRLFESWRS